MLDRGYFTPEFLAESKSHRPLTSRELKEVWDVRVAASHGVGSEFVRKWCTQTQAQRLLAAQIPVPPQESPSPFKAEIGNILDPR